MSKLDRLKHALAQNGITYEVTSGQALPDYAQMHDRAAPVPELVISPASDWGVSKVLSLFTELGIYDAVPVSVRSGGHGYHNGASCEGIMINLSQMDAGYITDDRLIVQPGCILGKIISRLHNAGKVLPHGDCFDVHAGGHFTTAGWDFILTRKYGLGCQQIQRATVVLWDGTILSVDADTHADILWALRGGAAAEVGVFTELSLWVQDAPPQAAWCFKLMDFAQLETCVRDRALEKAHCLPREISVSYRIHFEPGHPGPACSFNVFSLLTPHDTLHQIAEVMGPNVAAIFDPAPEWNTGSILDVRMITASDFLTENPEAIAEASSDKLRHAPLTYWEETSWRREMVDSYFTTLSDWTRPACDQMMLDLMQVCEDLKDDELRWRMYALSTIGSGRMREMDTAMHLGDVLSRFEMHWDEENTDEAKRARAFTDRIYTVLKRYSDPKPARIYRGDIWQAEQGADPALDAVRERYATRKVASLDFRKSA